MQMDKHTSEMVWTWTINELCRKVGLAEPATTYESSQKNKTEVLAGILIPL